MIELITAWILTTFLGFVPNQELLNSGHPETGAKHGAFFRIPLNTFSPTSENYFFFFPDYRLPTTDYSPLRTSPENRPPLLLSSEVLFLSNEVLVLLKQLWVLLKQVLVLPGEV